MCLYTMDPAAGGTVLPGILIEHQHARGRDTADFQSAPNSPSPLISFVVTVILQIAKEGKEESFFVLVCW